MISHCSDNKADRATGQYWEKQFCKMAASYGFLFSPLQIGRETSAQAYYQDGTAIKRLTLPDVTIWTAPGEHHEIKHKNPTRGGYFGLEQYRFEALLKFAQTTRQPVMYTIHNHDLAGGREQTVNQLKDWLTVDVLDLVGQWQEAHCNTWINGRKHDNVPLYYWPASLWQPLETYWFPF